VFEERCDLDIQRLRRETEDDHRAVEEMFPLMHEDLNVTQYTDCLLQMYGMVSAWEECSHEAAPGWMQPELVARRRKSMLELDLAWFGVKNTDELLPVMPEMKDLNSLLGAMYVMEGSTLGGQLIARQLRRTLHLSEGKGDAYFVGHGDQTGPMWKEFCEVLKMRVTDDETELVVLSAKAMFATYGSWMLGKSAMDGS
jgi:heme oxygenase (biliverdin-IX-beta and delta-forming)